MKLLLAPVLALAATACAIPSGSAAYAPPTNRSPVTSAPVTPSGPAASFGDGTHQVGVDIAPGRYKTVGPDLDDSWPSCYWARLKNDSGQFSAIIANGNTQGPASLTVKAGEFVEVSGGCQWKRA